MLDSLVNTVSRTLSATVRQLTAIVLRYPRRAVARLRSRFGVNRMSGDLTRAVTRGVTDTFTKDGH